MDISPMVIFGITYGGYEYPIHDPQFGVVLLGLCLVMGVLTVAAYWLGGYFE